MKDTALFQWRPMSLAPADRTPIVALGFVMYCGGWERPIDLVPDVNLIGRQWFGKEIGPGYYSHLDHGFSMGDVRNSRWMLPADYAAIVAELPGWRSAPGDRPVAFVRPPVRPPAGPKINAHYATIGRAPRFNAGAEIAWPHADNSGWQTAKTGSKDHACHPGYLDGDNVGSEPFRWCEVDDLIPTDWPRTCAAWSRQARR